MFSKKKRIGTVLFHFGLSVAVYWHIAVYKKILSLKRLHDVLSYTGVPFLTGEMVEKAEEGHDGVPGLDVLQAGGDALGIRSVHV